MSHIQRFLKGDEMTRVLWSMIPETLAFAPLGIGIVPYALPSSVDLAEATLEQIKTHDVVMWEKHGTVAVGQDIMDAFDQTDVLCKAANIYMCRRHDRCTDEGSAGCLQTAEETSVLKDRHKESGRNAIGFAHFLFDSISTAYSNLKPARRHLAPEM